jgi:hypothetical protein
METSAVYVSVSVQGEEHQHQHHQQQQQQQLQEEEQQLQQQQQQLQEEEQQLQEEEQQLQEEEQQLQEEEQQLQEEEELADEPAQEQEQVQDQDQEQAPGGVTTASPPSTTASPGAMPAAPVSSFQHAWDSLGRQHAAQSLCQLASIFQRWTVEPNKTELMTALNFLSGDFESERHCGGYTEDECAMPVRRIHMSRSTEDSHVIVHSHSVKDGNEEEHYRRSVHLEEDMTHVVELAVSEIKMQGVFKGYFSEFLVMSRLWTCIEHVVGSCEVSDEVFKKACFDEFRDIQDTFFFIDVARVTTMDDAASSNCMMIGTPRLVHLRLPIDLGLFGSRGFKAIVKALQWIHCFHFEVVDSKREVHHHNSGRRVFSLAWDKPTSSVVLKFVKEGQNFLWHDANHMAKSTQDFLQHGVSAQDRFIFPDESTIYFRISMSLNLFWNVSSPTTTLYLSATRKCCNDDTTGGRGTSMVVKLIKITGFSGWVTSLFVDDICEAVEIVLKFMDEEGNLKGSDEDVEISAEDSKNFDEPINNCSNDVECRSKHSGADGIVSGNVQEKAEFNTFSWHLLGTAPANSILLWIVHVLWHKLVMSAFLYEALHLWATIFDALGHHIAVPRSTPTTSTT